MTTLRRGTVLSFDAATWTALILLDGADAEAQIPVGQWISPGRMAADAEVAVACFDPTNADDGVVLGVYGALGAQDLATTSSPTFAGLTDTGSLAIGSAGLPAAGNVAATNANGAIVSLDSSAANQTAGLWVNDNGVTKGKVAYAGTNSVGNRYFGLLSANGADWLILATLDAKPIQFWTNGAIQMTLASGGGLTVVGSFGCNTKAAQAAGGTGATAGAYDTAAHRDALITLVNNIRAALVANGIMS